MPVGPDFRADAAAMAAAIDDDTVLVVASAPSYAHGVVDPVTEIAAAAAARGVRCHVDACIGGWVLPYAARLGRAVPAVDLRGRGRHLDLGRHPQVRLRPQGHLAAAAPRRRAAPTAVLRLRRVAGLHDAQRDDAVDALGRPDRRHVGGGPAHRRRGLPRARRAGPRRRSTRSWRASGASPPCGCVVTPDSTLVTLATDDTLRPVHADRRARLARVVRPAPAVLRAAAGRASTCR